jgi:hypothetical protein
MVINNLTLNCGSFSAVLRNMVKEKGVASRGLHSFTSQLNLSALYGIEGARRGYVARVEGTLGGAEGV